MTKKFLLSLTAGLLGGFLFLSANTSKGWTTSSLSIIPYLITAFLMNGPWAILSIFFALFLIVSIAPINIFFHFQQVLPALFLYHGIKKSFGGIISIGRAAFLGAILNIFGLIILCHLRPESLNWIEKTLTLTMENQNLGHKLSPAIEKTFLSLIPSLILMENLASYSISYLAVTFFLIRFGKNMTKGPPLTLFRIEWPLSWFLITGIIGIWFTKPWMPMGAFFVNILATSCILFTLQGIGITEFMMQLKNLSMGLKALLWLVILFTGLWPILMMTGIIDAWFDIRGIRQEEKRQ